MFPNFVLLQETVAYTYKSAVLYGAINGVSRNPPDPPAAIVGVVDKRIDWSVSDPGVLRFPTSRGCVWCITYTTCPGLRQDCAAVLTDVFKLKPAVILPRR